ncbi:hypothetical protein C1933_11650 [Stenotrophomonas sp. ZAC14D2_NAIMI4_6]|nr:hypothetical protein C1933_11650 [Stenotrophomonas sp. ZAC14D2_NAIMI4_6]
MPASLSIQTVPNRHSSASERVCRRACRCPGTGPCGAVANERSNKVMNIHVLRIGLLLLLHLAAFAVHAEGGCPSGMYPIGGQGVQGCAPIPGASGGAGPAASAAPARPLGEWLTRWGAVVESPSSNLVGTSANESSEERAVAVATRKCAAEGAQGCKPTVTYYNQCVAFAVPSSGKGQGSLDTAADTETVAQNAIGNCKDTGGGRCHVVYAECSLPEFSRF